MLNNTEIRTGSEKDSNSIQMGFLSLVHSLDYPFGKHHLVNIIKGARSKKISECQHDLLPEFGMGSTVTRDSLASVLDNLITEKFLDLSGGGFRPRVMLTEKGQRVLADISTSESRDVSPSRFKSVDQVHEKKFDCDQKLLAKLRLYRRIEMEEHNVPSYMIARESVLKEIARRYPTSIEELVSIKYFGPRLAEEYGDDILSIVKEHCRTSGGTNEENTANSLLQSGSNALNGEPNQNCSAVPASIVTKTKTPIETTLQRYWGFPSFHPLQKEVIEHLLGGSDVLFLMATGGGKSLCYQLPAVHTEKLTVVISPLISLMKDQVDDLVKRGIHAATINSSMSPKTNEMTGERVRSGKICLLYVSPEKFVSSSFLSFLHSVPLSMIAIDEAHCISMWGHAFRPEYRELSLIKTEFPTIPVIAMTATATKVVREDIVKQLGMKQPQVFVGSFNRQNLSYEVRPKKGHFGNLVDYLSQHRVQSGIVYCMTRKGTERLAEKLTAEGIHAIFYHAGLDPDMRRKRQEQFINNKVYIVCATIAFGMGIDKPDIRFVIHYDLPKSVEGYYQETGRAGRDNLPSECILYYHPSDFFTVLSLIKSNDLPPEQFAVEEQKLKDLIEFCELNTCRRKYLLNYFDEDYTEENCSGCDICLHHSSGDDHQDEAHKILLALEDVDGRFSKRMFKYLISGYRGKRALAANLDNEQYFGICQKYDHKNYDRWIDELIQLGCIGQDIENRDELFITAKGRQVLEGKMSVELSEVPYGYSDNQNKEYKNLSDVLDDITVRSERLKEIGVDTGSHENNTEENRSGCDTCLHHLEDDEQQDEAHKILLALGDVDGRFSKRMFQCLISGYQGELSCDAEMDRERYFGICRKYNPKEYDRWIDELIQQGCIGQDSENRNYPFLTGKGRKVLEGNLSVELSDPLFVDPPIVDPPRIHPNYRTKYQKKSSRVLENSNAHPNPIIQNSGSADSSQSPELLHNSKPDKGLSSQEPKDNPFFSQLRAIQIKMIQREDYDPGKIFNNQALSEIITRMPLTNEEFLEIPGMTPSDWDIYREYYLKTIIGFIGEGASRDICQGNDEEPPKMLYRESDGNNVTPVVVIDGNDIRHPYDTLLFDELCAIRKEIAEENEIFEGSVLSKKNIKELCINYPCFESDIIILWPWANSSFMQKNHLIFDHISRYCDTHGITPPLPDSYVRIPRKEKIPGNSAYESLRLYRKGNSLSEIAKIRKFRENTISNHMVSIFRLDKTLNINEFVEPDRIKTITKALETIGDEYLKPVREYLGEEYSYAEIKFVRAYLARCRDISV